MFKASYCGNMYEDDLLIVQYLCLCCDEMLTVFAMSELSKHHHVHELFWIRKVHVDMVT